MSADGQPPLPSGIHSCPAYYRIATVTLQIDAPRCQTEVSDHVDKVHPLRRSFEREQTADHAGCISSPKHRKQHDSEPTSRSTNPCYLSTVHSPCSRLPAPSVFFWTWQTCGEEREGKGGGRKWNLHRVGRIDGVAVLPTKVQHLVSAVGTI